MIYLASPYTHADAKVRESRALAAHCYTGWAMGFGHIVYSPIVHGHALHVSASVTAEQSADHGFWMTHCYGMLAAASTLYVLPIDGWRESKGVFLEIQRARSLGIPVHIVQHVPSFLKYQIELVEEEELKLCDYGSV